MVLAKDLRGEARSRICQLITVDTRSARYIEIWAKPEDAHRYLASGQEAILKTLDPGFSLDSKDRFRPWSE